MTAIAPPPQDLRGRLAARRAEILRAVPTSPVGSASERPPFADLGRVYAKALDELVVEIHERAAVEAGPALVADFRALEIACVGSWGRGAVAFGSDLDVRIVGEEGRARAFAESFLYPLWDAGVPVGHQVVSPRELVDAARDDLPTATSILDYRHLAGDRGPGDELRRRAAEGLFAHSELPRFLARLEDEVKGRHARFGGSVYLLEPDVKNAAGGLRDLDVVRWAAQARYGVGGLDELVRVGALVPREVAELSAAHDLLWEVRLLLHAHAGRRSDRLTFDEQESIAALLGYGEGGEAVEHFMSTYYRTARSVERALDRMIARATPVLSRRRPRDEDLGGGVRLFDGCVSTTDAALLKTDPALALRLVDEAVNRGVPILPFARDAITSACSDPSFAADLRASAEASRLFVDLVSTCKETALRGGSAVRELHDVGLLLAMIPEFSPVVGRVHHDTYHVYTVDVHSVAAVDRLAALARGELAAEFPVASRIAAEIARPKMLLFATLLHDVGKAIGGTDHSQRGAEMAEGILARLGLAPEDVAEACHLIKKHLVMYRQATRRDLDDPATIEEFSGEVHGREGLRDLFLLTVADLSTTSPTSMTSWKARMLDELFVATDRALEGTVGDAERVARAAAEVERAAQALPAANAGDKDARLAFLRTYLASMPERYALANAPAAILAHAEVARMHERDTGARALVALVPSRHPEAAEICVVAPDRPGLLAAITAAIAASRLEVHAAQIHSRKAAGGVQAVDLFWVRDRAEGVDGVARALAKLVRDIHAVLGGDVTASELANRRAKGAAYERATPKITSQVSIDARASSRHTVIEVVSRDRPGLLFAISDALHRLGLSIAVAKINTEGSRAADVFYVSEADGSRLAPGKRSQEVKDGLLAALAAFGGEATTLAPP